MSLRKNPAKVAVRLKAAAIKKKQIKISTENAELLAPRLSMFQLNITNDEF